MVDWEQMFQLQLQLDEFSIALHRLKAKGVELPPPSGMWLQSNAGHASGGVNILGTRQGDLLTVFRPSFCIH